MLIGCHALVSMQHEPLSIGELHRIPTTNNQPIAKVRCKQGAHALEPLPISELSLASNPQTQTQIFHLMETSWAW